MLILKKKKESPCLTPLVRQEYLTSEVSSLFSVVAIEQFRSDTASNPTWKEESEEKIPFVAGGRDT